MVNVVLLSCVLASTTSPDYEEHQYIETPNWKAEYSVFYWEDTDKFVYKLYNDESSLFSITYFEVFNAFAYDYEIEPGKWKTIDIFGDGSGYSDVYGILYSDYDGSNYFFDTIAPSVVPAPGVLSFLALAPVMGRQRRRRK